LGLVAGAPRPLGQPSDRLVEPAVGLCGGFGGSLAEHERGVLAAGQLADLPQPADRDLHLPRAPRPGDRLDHGGHRQSGGSGGDQRLVDVLAERHR
jgi:hypothetical protein